MDTGEFIALDATEDELRRIANENRERATVLGEALSDLANRTHNNYHASSQLPFDKCNYTSCRKVRMLLAGGDYTLPSARL